MCPHLTTLINLATDPTTDDGLNGIFNCIFNDDLTIAPNSELALQSVSLNKALNFLDIKDSNSNTIIKFKFQVDTERTVHLDPQILTKSNVLAFFQRLQNLMNKELRIATPGEYGAEITIGINESEKVFFNFEQKPPVPYDEDDLEDLLVFNNIDFSGTVIEGTVQNENDFIRLGNYLWCEADLISSCGQFRGRVLDFDNTDPAYVSGVFFGLLETTPDNLQNLKNRDGINFDSFDFAIRTNRDYLNTSNYEYKTPDNANYQTSTITPFKVNRTNTINNDVISFDVEDGKIKLRIYTNEAGGTTHTMATVDYPRNTEDNLLFKNYIGLVALLDDERTVALDVVQISQSTYESENSLSIQSQTVGATPIPNPNLNETVKQLTFPNLEFANFFGFNSLIQNEEGLATPDSIFKANTMFSNVLSTNTYLIELLNLPLNSFNSVAKGRRNILAPIPVSERVVSNTGQIQYEPNNIIYLSLRNNYPITLRNLRARILSHDLTPIQTEGQAELNLILKEDKEEVAKMTPKY